MANEEELNDDPALTKLKQLQEEFETHKKRLKQLATDLGGKITAGTLGEAEQREAILGLYLELHDTCLSLQADLTATIIEEWSKADEEEDEDPGEDEEEEVDDPEAGDDEDSLSQLLPGDAAQLRRSCTELVALYDAMLTSPGYSEDDKKAIGAKQRDAKASLDLIDEIELAPAAAARPS